MRFEWDHEKNTTNGRKHGIRFEQAIFVFADPDAISIHDIGHAEQEDRWITLGKIGNLAIIVVVHTDRIRKEGEFIRIISARNATKREAAEYLKRTGAE